MSKSSRPWKAFPNEFNISRPVIIKDAHGQYVASVANGDVETAAYIVKCVNESKDEKTPLVFRFSRNHNALEINIRCDRCPTEQEVEDAVMKEFPHADQRTTPVQSYIDSRYKEWHRYGYVDMTMPYPWRNVVWQEKRK